MKRNTIVSFLFQHNLDNTDLHSTNKILLVQSKSIKNTSSTSRIRIYRYIVEKPLVRRIIRRKFILLNNTEEEEKEKDERDQERCGGYWNVCCSCCSPWCCCLLTMLLTAMILAGLIILLVLLLKNSSTMTTSGKNFSILKLFSLSFYLETLISISTQSESSLNQILSNQICLITFHLSNNHKRNNNFSYYNND